MSPPLRRFCRLPGRIATCLGWIPSDGKGDSGFHPANRRSTARGPEPSHSLDEGKVRHERSRNLSTNLNHLYRIGPLMPITIGYIHTGGDRLYVRVFYDSTFVPGAGQTFSDAPLINNANPAFGPTGFCMLVVNTSGENGTASVWGADGVLLVDHIKVPTGNPVTTGAARSRTAAQVAALGWTTRGDVGTIFME